MSHIKNNTLNGVRCTAQHCVYHEQDTNCCTAKSICVGYEGSESKTQTVCSTFENRRQV